MAERFFYISPNIPTTDFCSFLHKFVYFVNSKHAAKKLFSMCSKIAKTY